MRTREDFYKEYDAIMPLFCEPYKKFLEIGAEALPGSIKSVYDLGIGTGNFSLEVLRRIPGVKIYGVDKDPRALTKAKIKIPEAILYNGDMFSVPFPSVDAIISSMATHHFNDKTRAEKLVQIARSSPFFVNFDMVLFPDYDMNTTIEEISKYARTKVTPEEVREIEKEVRLHDNPMPLEEAISAFTSEGFEFNIIAQNPPYVVYTVSPAIKE